VRQFWRRPAYLDGRKSRRMRAVYDEEQAAISRLRSAGQLASAHGRVALLRRCERDLAQ
jgi:hypothetical protein